MGKKTIKTIQEEAKESKKEMKSGKEVVKDGEEIKDGKEEASETKTKRQPKVRGKKYQAAKTKVDKNKLYPLEEAIELVKKTSLSKFVGNLEVHLLVKKKGDLGEVNLPFFKGEAKKVVVATDEIVEEIKKGNIDFQVLLASPKMMPKLVPFARVLGPKGLMPNPKNGTLVDKPEEAVKKFSSKGMKIRTEKKAPVVHLIAGKLDQPEKELVANVEAIIKIIGALQIIKLSLAATMGPGVKVKI